MAGPLDRGRPGQVLERRPQRRGQGRRRGRRREQDDLAGAGRAHRGVDGRPHGVPGSVEGGLQPGEVPARRGERGARVGDERPHGAQPGRRGGHGGLVEEVGVEHGRGRAERRAGGGDRLGPARGGHHGVVQEAGAQHAGREATGRPAGTPGRRQPLAGGRQRRRKQPRRKRMSGGVITVSPAAPMRRLTCSWVSDRASMTVAGAPARRIAPAKASRSTGAAGRHGRP